MKSIHLLGIRNMAFVCGCPHSGTTLTATILAAHPRVYVPLVETRAFRVSGRERAKALNAMRWQALRRGKTYIVEKTPLHVERMEDIRQYFPGARFVLLMRDGRDVTASLGQRHGGDFKAALDRWTGVAEIVLSERQSPDVFVLRYEELVTAAKPTIRGVTEFLGLPYSDDLLDYYQRPRFWFGTNEARKTSGVGRELNPLRNWQVNQPIFDGRGRWKNELPDEVALRFQGGRPRELMEAFDYSV